MSSQAFSGGIFACSNQDHYGSLPIDNCMHKVLHQIDGHRSLAGAAFVIGFTMMEMQEITRENIYASRAGDEVDQARLSKRW